MNNNTITYNIDDKLYINLTNRCSNSCTFCVRNNNDGVEGYYLWLQNEPHVSEVFAEMGELTGYREVVFCGFGEPLYRLDAIIEICDYAHSKGVKTRLNTNGQADLITGKDNVAELLKGHLDSVNISLNNVTAADYQKVCLPIFGEAAYESMLRFARSCVGVIPSVTLSVVDIIGKKGIEKAQAIADGIGAKLRVRKYIK